MNRNPTRRRRFLADLGDTRRRHSSERTRAHRDRRERPRLGLGRDTQRRKRSGVRRRHWQHVHLLSGDLGSLTVEMSLIDSILRFAMNLTQATGGSLTEPELAAGDETPAGRETPRTHRHHPVGRRRLRCRDAGGSRVDAAIRKTARLFRQFIDGDSLGRDCLTRT